MEDQSLTKKNILITGGAGFIGSQIASSLVEMNDVTVIDNLSTGLRANVPDGAEFVEMDIRATNDLAKIVQDADIVFHEAAVVSVAQSVEDPKLSHEVNASATVSLLEAARNSDTRVILASSAAVYGRPTETPISESEPFSPTSPYGLNKATIDQYARMYHDLYGLETVSLRYFNVYGPGQQGGHYAGVIDIFLEQALRGDSITIHGDGTQTRDFVHVQDVVDANVRAAITPHVGKAYNIGTGTSVSIFELAETIRDVTNSDSEIIHTDARPGDIEQSHADVTKAKTELGYVPNIELKYGINTLVE